MAISKQKITYLRSLQNRAARLENKRFLVEGKKAILEVINSDFRIVEGFLVQIFLKIVPNFRLYWMASMIQEISVLSLELLIGMVFLRLLHHPIRSIFIIPKR